MIHLERADALDVLQSLDDLSVDVVLTDPPYNAAARNARSIYDGKASPSSLGRSALGKEGAGIAWHLTDEEIPILVSEFLRVSRRWVVVFCALEHLGKIHDAAGGFYDAKKNPEGAFVRSCTWDRNNTGAPQLTGDRPAQGAEGIAVLHAPGEPRKRWNGRGKRGIYRHSVCRRKGRHPAEKPLPLIEELLLDFTEPGDLVLDPFCGSGTVGVACKRQGRSFFGVDFGEPDEEHAQAGRPWIDIARERIERGE